MTTAIAILVSLLLMLVPLAPRATAGFLPPAPRGGVVTTGIASWYGGSRGFRGVPHAAVPGGHWDSTAWGRAVVTANGRSVVVLLVDSCACYVGTARERVIDLSIEAVRALGLDPHRGLFSVTIREVP